MTLVGYIYFFTIDTVVQTYFFTIDTVVLTYFLTFYGPKLYKIASPVS